MEYSTFSIFSRCRRSVEGSTNKYVNNFLNDCDKNLFDHDLQEVMIEILATSFKW
jgi:hypothetical protein